MKGRDSNNTSKASFGSFSSSKQQPKFLGLFFWCFSNQAIPTFEPSRRPILHPNVLIDIEKPPVKSFLASQTDMSRDEPTCASIRRQQDGARVYHLDKVFILGDIHKIVAKITTKHITSHRVSRIPSVTAISKEVNKQKHSIEENPAPTMPIFLKQEIFSMYDKGIRALKWHEITPENIAIHIAERLHCNMIIDALCGCGGNTIQFAKHCDYVLGIDIEPEKTLSARHNAQIYGVHHKIDFLTVDFLKLKNLMGDVVFLGPSDIRKNPNETYSLFEHAEPDLRNLIAKSLEISCCIALKLPGDTDLEELADLFHVSLERFRLYSKRFCIEIERIVNSNNEIECIVVYFGDCSSIELSEEYEAIYEYLASHENPEWKEKYPFHTLVAILRSVGTRKFFKHIAKIEESLFSVDKPQLSLFDTFLEELIEKNIFTANSLKKLIEDSSHTSKIRAPALTKKHASVTNSMLAQKLTSTLSLDVRHTSDKVIKFGSNASQEGKVLKVNYFGVKPDPEVVAIESLEDVDLQKTIEEKTIWETNENNTKHNNSVLQEEITEKKLEEEELSDLGVSSYSVSSGYLRESEHGSPRDFRKGRDLINISFEGSDRGNSIHRDKDEASVSDVSFKRGVSTPIKLQGEDVENMDIRSRVSMNSKKSQKL